MLIFGAMLVSWALNSFCLLIFRKRSLLLSEHVSTVSGPKKGVVCQFLCIFFHMRSLYILEIDRKCI